MTTVVLVTKNGRACLAADTLARYGESKEPAKLIANHDKIVSVGDHTTGDVFMAPTGPASGQLVLRSYFSDQEVLRKFGSDLEIFETVLELHKGLKADYGLNPKEDETDPFESIQMELAVCCPAGIFGVYPLRSVQHYTRYYAFGSGSTYALGALHALWERYSEPEDLARAAIEAAAAYDDGTALPITIKSVHLRTHNGALKHRIPAH
ncbi:MAG: ATP-dependent HslUV protease subunit HslV [Planctomycetota bacterium]|jgi:ATP-dependent HslUV protease subunit HslV